MRSGLLLTVALLAAPACAQTDRPVPDALPASARVDSVVSRPDATRTDSTRTETTELPLGDGTVSVVVHTAPGTGLNALNLHDDEDTSVEAALADLRQRGGRVVELRHTGGRHVVFSVDGRTYTADPNRMFTDAGRRRTLASLSADAPAARAALAAFAEAVLVAYTAVRPEVVVTLHNNTDGAYSARSYAAGGEYASDAAAVTVQPGSDADDFFFVTDRALYDALVARGFNAVLQDNDAATDDGSLSVWAAQNGVPYVNVEAQHGHRAEQARMLGALADVLAARPR